MFEHFPIIFILLYIPLKSDKNLKPSFKLIPNISAVFAAANAFSILCFPASGISYVSFSNSKTVFSIDFPFILMFFDEKYILFLNSSAIS